jgi:hypothetical protein
MRVEWSVDIGPESDCLELPWRSEDGEFRYYDLRNHPERLLDILETHENRELAEFLAAINAQRSFFLSAKCDVWSSDSFSELTVEEIEFRKPCKFASYVDVVFVDDKARLNFTRHENLAIELSKLLDLVPNFDAMVEIIIRRCYFHTKENEDESEDGFSVTLFISGYGTDILSARKSWAITLKLIENALRQIGAKHS